jgi:hypothetical protein
VYNKIKFSHKEEFLIMQWKRWVKGFCLLTLATTFLCAAACGGNGGNSQTGSQTSSEEGFKPQDLPFYVDPETAKYGEYTQEKLWTPYWQGNVIYNETVMLTDDGNLITGKLQYKPVKILSVRDYTWEKEYPATEYSVEGNVISIDALSTLPRLKEENFRGENLPDGYKIVNSIATVETDVVKMGTTIYTEGSLIYGHQISVSYVYDPADITVAPSVFDAPKTKAKLAAGEDITIVTTGDSVMAGCSTSGYFGHTPFMPTRSEPSQPWL